MPRLPRDSIFTPFFEQALFGANFSGKNNYILFQKSPSDKVLRFLIYSLLAFSGNVPLMDEVLSSYLFLIFHELLLRYNNERVISPSSKLKGIPPNASELIDYIFKHYDSVSLSSASAHFHFNPQYMGKLVRRLTGESFVDLVRNIRLIKAAELISETDRSIAVIANEVGYQNISYFTVYFKTIMAVHRPNIAICRALDIRTVDILEPVCHVSHIELAIVKEDMRHLG